jgi:hypothetical protein
MNREDLAVCQLPKKRTGVLLKRLADASATKVAFVGLLIYLGVVFVFWGIEYFYMTKGSPLVIYQDENDRHEKILKPADGCQILYFNFVTILTIGYGDFTPAGIGRFLAILEAIIGTGVVGVSIAALTAKFLSAPRAAVVFSRYAYYCYEDGRFLVIFLNTTRNLLINAEMSSFFKLGGDWGVRPSIRSPLITRAVQTFFMDQVPKSELVTKLKEGDAFRFGISGQIGDTKYSTAIQYSPHEIIVIPNRNELTEYEGFRSVDLTSDEFVKMFHYRPPNSLTLVAYVDHLRDVEHASR